ncbi:MAG: class I tRNA ligase family protein [Rickettsiales bacterium]|jgi:leucyl-tRNA synthetase|nr:class I tRNA ligase family protein [Rickettsiales bacterium]
MEYKHKEIEDKWQKYWKENNTFQFDNNSTKQKYYALSMFLYPSGEMHAGHLRNFVIGDVNARYKRMKGFNVLHPTGADAFGLPAENAAIKNNAHPSDWTYKNLDRILKDMLSCGLSFDTTRTFATCDPEYYGFQQEIFIKMYEKGLVYQKESYVNWDPVDQTVLANEQVINGRGWRSDAIVERRLLKQWFIKITDYAEELVDNLKNGKLDGWPEKVKIMQENWIGKSEGAIVEFKIVGDETQNGGEDGIIKVYTTRPDTLFGASFLGISADHPLAKKLAEENKEIADFIEEIKRGTTTEEELETAEKKGIFTGLYVKNPFLPEQHLPVYIANFILIDYGTGAIFGCPAHDERDFDFAVKYGLPINKVVLEKDKYEKLKHLIDTELSNELEHNNIIHRFYCQDPYFDYIKKGVKTIEGCENSPKHQTYKVGDVINFYHDNDCFFAEITKISKYQNPKEFLKDNDLSNVLPNVQSVEEGEKIYASLNGNTDKYDFLGIHLKLVDKKDLLNTEEGIAFKSSFLNGLTTKEAKTKAIDKIEELKIGTRKINYRLRDWGVSRQRYWGCPIPMVHCKKCGTNPEKLENLPIKLPKDVVFDGKGNPLDKHPTWKQCKCPVCGGDAVRETDTMDTFVDSSWYFLRFVDLDKEHPVNTDLVNKIMPIDQYVGGIEHACLHLIYARFFTKVMADLGYYDKNIREPAVRLLNQGMVQMKAYKTEKEWISPKNVIEKDEKYFVKNTGEEVKCKGIIKMSKSKSNVVGVSDFKEEFGADSSRMFVLSDNPPTNDFEWTVDGIKSCWKYLNKIWNLVVNYKQIGDMDNSLMVENHKAIKDVTNYMENLEYNKAIARIREFSNAIEKAQGDKLFAIKNLVKMLAPFTPHICEELNEFLREKMTLDLADYPIFDEKLTVDSEIVIAVQINGKIRGEFKIKKDADKNEIETIAKQQESIKKYLDGATIKKVIVVPNKLISFVI